MVALQNQEIAIIEITAEIGMVDRVPIVDLDLIEDRVLLDRKVKIADHVQRGRIADLDLKEDLVLLVQKAKTAGPDQRDRIADHVLHVQRVKTVDLDQKDKIVRKELRQ
jgi:hypothetical protein